MNLLEKLLSDFLTAIPKLAGAITLVIIGYILSKAVIKILTIILEKIGVDKLTEKLNDIDMVQKSNVQVKLSNILPYDACFPYCSDGCFGYACCFTTYCGYYQLHT